MISMSARSGENKLVPKLSKKWNRYRTEPGRRTKLGASMTTLIGYSGSCITGRSGLNNWVAMTIGP